MTRFDGRLLLFFDSQRFIIRVGIGQHGESGRGGAA
jgi:hypothetical protein